MKTDSEIINLTWTKLQEFGEQFDEETRDHLFWMLNEVKGRYIHVEDIRKVNRWIGFVHGTLVALTDCTTEELRNMIREEV